MTDNNTPQYTKESPITRILLVRHGETAWNREHRFQGRSNTLLNEKGREESRALAHALKDETITAAYSSPLGRALETVKLIIHHHPTARISEEEDFVEMDLGTFEGMEAQFWVSHYPEFLERWRDTPSSVNMPGGECLKEVQTRAVNALKRIIDRHPPGSTLLICSHNFVILTILCHAMNIHLDDFRKIKQSTTALNILCKQGENLWAEVVNDRSHLELI